jgi:hypothetical protein
MLVINKPAPGSGATFFAQIIGAVYAGQPPLVEIAPAMDDVEEWRKVIAGILRRDNVIGLLDNITEPIGNAVLMALLTAPTLSVRILGSNDMPVLRNNVLWVATGNNAARPLDDMIRRVFQARIDTGLEHPEDRTFTRNPLAHAIQHRREILAAILTLIRAYLAAGKPQADVPFLASFEEWASLVGGVLAYAGIPGFLANREKARESSNEEGKYWAAFTAALFAWQRNADTGFKTGDLLVPVKDNFDGRLRGYNWATPELEAALPPELRVHSGEKRLLTLAGRAFAEHIDRPHGKHVIKRLSKHAGSITYVVRLAGEECKPKPTDWVTGGDSQDDDPHPDFQEENDDEVTLGDSF